MKAGTTRVSSRGQIVIPESVKKSVGLREGDDLLVVAIGETIVIKKLSKMTFEEVARPIWRTVRELGLDEGDINALIEEAKTATRP